MRGEHKNFNCNSTRNAEKNFSFPRVKSCFCRRKGCDVRRISLNSSPFRKERIGGYERKANCFSSREIPSLRDGNEAATVFAAGLVMDQFF